MNQTPFRVLLAPQQAKSPARASDIVDIEIPWGPQERWVDVGIAKGVSFVESATFTGVHLEVGARPTLVSRVFYGYWAGIQPDKFALFHNKFKIAFAYKDGGTEELWIRYHDWAKHDGTDLIVSSEWKILT